MRADRTLPKRAKELAAECKRVISMRYSSLSEEALVNPDKGTEFQGFVVDSSTNLDTGIRMNILSENTPEARAKRISYFIKVIREAVSNKDFYTAQTIIGALGSTTIRQLYLTWQHIPEEDKLFVRDLAFYIGTGKGILQCEMAKERNTFEVTPALPSITTLNSEYKNSIVQNTENLLHRLQVNLTAKDNSLPKEILDIKYLLHRSNLTKMIQDDNLANSDRDINIIVKEIVNSRIQTLIEAYKIKNTNLADLDYEADIKGKVDKIVDAAFSWINIIKYSKDLKTCMTNAYKDELDLSDNKYIDGADEPEIERVFQVHKSNEKSELQKRGERVGAAPEEKATFKDIMQLKCLDAKQKYDFFIIKLNQKIKKAEEVKAEGGKPNEIEESDIAQLKAYVDQLKPKAEKASMIDSPSISARSPFNLFRSRTGSRTSSVNESSFEGTPPSPLTSSGSIKLSRTKTLPKSLLAKRNSSRDNSLIESRGESPNTVNSTKQRSDSLIDILADRSSGALVKTEGVKDIACLPGSETACKNNILAALNTLSKNPDASKRYDMLRSDESRQLYQSCELETVAQAWLVANESQNQDANLEAKRIIHERYPSIIVDDDQIVTRTRSKRGELPPVAVETKITEAQNGDLESVQAEVERMLKRSRLLVDKHERLDAKTEIKEFIKSSNISEAEKLALLNKAARDLLFIKQTRAQEQNPDAPRAEGSTTAVAKKLAGEHRNKAASMLGQGTQHKQSDTRPIPQTREKPTPPPRRPLPPKSTEPLAPVDEAKSNYKPGKK